MSIAFLKHVNIRRKMLLFSPVTALTVSDLFLASPSSFLSAFKVLYSIG